MRYRVVLVPFPFDDLSGTKVRPAVCLTEAVGTHKHVVLAFITSNLSAKLEASDVLLDPTNANFRSTGLKVRSALRLHRVITVSASIIIRQLGVLQPEAQHEVQQRLRELFRL
jgi:mRNA interferase MazF